MKCTPWNSIPLNHSGRILYYSVAPLALFSPLVFSSAGARSGSGMKLKVKTKSIAYTGGYTRMCWIWKPEKCLMLERFQKIVGKLFTTRWCQGKQSWAASKPLTPFRITPSAYLLCYFLDLAQSKEKCSILTTKED